MVWSSVRAQLRKSRFHTTRVQQARKPSTVCPCGFYRRSNISGSYNGGQHDGVLRTPCRVRMSTTMVMKGTSRCWPVLRGTIPHGLRRSVSSCDQLAKNYVDLHVADRSSSWPFHGNLSWFPGLCRTRTLLERDICDLYQV